MREYILRYGAVQRTVLQSQEEEHGECVIRSRDTRYVGVWGVAHQPIVDVDGRLQSWGR